MQRTRLDEQELARREWRIREEERRQEKEMERVRLETTEGVRITFGRWRPDASGTMNGEDGSDDRWQQDLLVVKKMAGGGGEDKRGSSSFEQVTADVHQPG